MANKEIEVLKDIVVICNKYKCKSSSVISNAFSEIINDVEVSTKDEEQKGDAQ